MTVTFIAGDAAYSRVQENSLLCKKKNLFLQNCNILSSYLSLIFSQLTNFLQLSRNPTLMIILSTTQKNPS